MSRRLNAAVLAVAAALAVALPAILAAAKVKAPLVLAASAAMAAVFAIFAAYWIDSLIELLRRDRSDQMALRGGLVMCGNRLPICPPVPAPLVLWVHPPLPPPTGP